MAMRPRIGCVNCASVRACSPTTAPGFRIDPATRASQAHALGPAYVDAWREARRTRQMRAAGVVAGALAAVATPADPLAAFCIGAIGAHFLPAMARHTLPPLPPGFPLHRAFTPCPAYAAAALWIIAAPLLARLVTPLLIPL